MDQYMFCCKVGRSKFMLALFLLYNVAIYIVKGEVFVVVVVVVVVDFRGSALELALVLPEGRGLELILRGGVRAEPGCTEIQTNNGVGDRKKEATTGLLQY